MPRDVLLFLVLVAVLLNLALLVGVAIARRRWAASQARPRPHIAQRAAPGSSPIPPVSPRPRPAAWATTGVRPLPAFGAPPRARPITAPPVAEQVSQAMPPLPEVSEPVVGALASDVTAPPATTATLDELPEVTGETAPDAPAAGSNGEAPGAAQAELATRRGRRFVMPRNDEDKGRTERAIEAFLGEPAPSGSSSSHRPRRRARRQRPAGEAAGPLVLVAALGGFDQLRQTMGREGAVRFAEAYGEALRATLRSGDHVTDLGHGRLRLVVHADDEGARALMDRAKAVCEPWLRLAPVPLSLRVRPMPDPRSTNGHRPDGPERRRAEGSAVESSASAAMPARPAQGRSDAESRRLAAG
jgi:hypothetical protein